MKIRFHLSSGQSLVLDAPADSDRQCLALPKDHCRFAFWRKATRDKRITGHAMVWEVVT